MKENLNKKINCIANKIQRCYNIQERRKFYAKIINKRLPKQLKNILKTRHLLTTFLTFPILPTAISSATILVVARFIPDKEIVMAKPYIDITSPYKPTASAPIF